MIGLREAPGDRDFINKLKTPKVGCFQGGLLFLGFKREGIFFSLRESSAARGGDHVRNVSKDDPTARSLFQHLF